MDWIYTDRNGNKREATPEQWVTLDRMSRLEDINQERERMLSVLSGVFYDYPDDDIRSLYEHLKDMTRTRIELTFTEIAALEDKLYMQEAKDAELTG